MSCSTSTAPRAAAECTGAVRAMNVDPGVARQRQLEALGGLPVERRPDLARRCRAAGRSRGSAGPPAASCSLSIRRAAAFTSCRRPCSLTTRTPSIMPLRMASMRARSASSCAARLRDLADRVVEHARDGADLVGAVVAHRLRDSRRPRSVPPLPRSRAPGGSASADAAHDSAIATSEPGDHADERDRRTAASCSAISVSGSASRTRARTGAPGLRTGTATYSMSVPSVVLWRRAMPTPCRRACCDFGRVRRGSRACGARRRQLRVADHRAVRGDERHPRRHQPADRVGLGVELLGVAAWRCDRVSAASRASLIEPVLDPLAQGPPHRPRHQHRRDDHRHGRSEQRAEEQPRAEGHRRLAGAE